MLQQELHYRSGTLSNIYVKYRLCFPVWVEDLLANCDFFLLEVYFLHVYILKLFFKSRLLEYIPINNFVTVYFIHEKQCLEITSFKDTFH